MHIDDGFIRETFFQIFFLRKGFAYPFIIASKMKKVKTTKCRLAFTQRKSR